MNSVVTTEVRSKIMRNIRGRNTVPERRVRSFLHSMGFRFRIHAKELPGKPDIVMPKYRAVIFVHGCFWHKHPGCKDSHVPKSNVAYWGSKLNKNVERDSLHQIALENMGWRVIIIWACELGRLGEEVPGLIEKICQPSMVQEPYG